MAFHLACPITCLKICQCPLGFCGSTRSRDGRSSFLQDVERLQSLLRNPNILAAGGRETAEVLVPRVSRVSNGEDAADEREERVSSRHGSLRKKAALASIAAEEYARKLELGELDASQVADAFVQQGKFKPTNLSLEEVNRRNTSQEENGSTLQKHVCRICVTAEDEGTEKARRMLACKICNRKYHRNCLKGWAKNRDLFNWAYWRCPSCVNCEVCRQVGDPSKLMFCKRCDAAYHSYCQQPPQKNVPLGPFLCPRHTWCHSCGSTVPGSGLSTRWFVGYTSCDACGRLFSKGKYCPICLKVYRDSESTPMVCCDACQCWVHCVCDGISEEKYRQFQTDRNLFYKCGACRGECYKVKHLEDAVREIWRRRDELERDDMRKLRDAAGLPTKEEMLQFCPSDDEGPMPGNTKEVVKKKLKALTKGLSEKGFKQGIDVKPKEHVKKHAKKQSKQKDRVPADAIAKTLQMSLHGHKSEVKLEALSQNQNQVSMENENNGEPPSMPDSHRSPFNRKVSNSEKLDLVMDGSVDENSKPIVALEGRSLNGKKNNKGTKGTNNSRLSQGQIHEEVVTEAENNASNGESSKSKRFIIHFTSKNKNQNSGQGDQNAVVELSNSRREEGSGSSQGIASNYFNKRRHQSDHEDINNVGKKARISHNDDLSFQKAGQKRVGSDVSFYGLHQETDTNGKSNALSTNMVADKGKATHFGKIHTNGSQDGLNSSTEKKKIKLIHSGQKNENNEVKATETMAESSPKTTPLVWKIKRPSLENTSLLQRQRDEDEGNVTKGTRSKRKRPTTTEAERHTDHVFIRNDNTRSVDFNWIIKRLGKDAVGKRVEVNQLSGDSWWRGSVTGLKAQDLIVLYDNGREDIIELNRQRVRFVSQEKPQSKRPRS